jgi:cytochrome c-type biogenesis protein
MIETLLNNLPSYIQEAPYLAYPAAYLGGVLVSFTPCVYPVIPVAVAYVTGASEGGRKSSASLSLVYILGMALTYTALGVIASLTGKLFGRIQANPWTHIVVANIFILMGLSMMEVFSLPVPEFLTGLQKKEMKKGWAGSFVLGITSGFIMGPCSAPVLIVLLGYVAARQGVIYGMSLLFMFALGMGTLLFILGTFAGFIAALPKAGYWMVRVRKTLGWVLIFMGEYFLFMSGRLWI